jgi:APA family basic amino acid/polyamine antiporter
LAVTGYLGVFFPNITQSPLLSAIVSLSFIWLVTGFNVMGVKASSTFQLVTSLLKILPLFIIIWAYVGLEAVTLTSDDMISPQKNIPKALVVGTLTVIADYLLISYGVMLLVPLDSLVNSTSPIADAASVLFGPWGAGLIAIVGLVSIISSINVNVIIVGVMPQTMSQDKVFPQYLARLNKAG